MKILLFGILVLSLNLSCKTTGEFKGQNQSSVKEQELCAQNFEDNILIQILAKKYEADWRLSFIVYSKIKGQPMVEKLYRHYIQCTGYDLTLDASEFENLRIEHNWNHPGSVMNSILTNTADYCEKGIVRHFSEINHPYLRTGEDTLGNFEAKVKNAKAECINGKVQVSGYLTYRDTFDFDRANRPFLKEVATTIGREAIPGRGFTLYSTPQFVIIK